MQKNIKPLQWIYCYSKKYLWLVAILSGISGLIAGSFILMALVSSRILDIASGAVRGSILFSATLLMGLLSTQIILNIVNSNIRVRVAGKIEMQLRQGIFAELLKKPYLKISGFHSGEILNRMTSDIDIVVGGVTGMLPQVISLGTRLVAGLFVLFRIDFYFTLAVLLSGAAVCLFGRIYSRKFRFLHKAVQESSGKVRSFLQECIENLVVIKSFSNEDLIQQKLNSCQMENYQHRIRRNMVSNLANTSFYAVFTAGYYFALIWGAVQISRGRLTFGILTAFLQIIGQIRMPFRNISGLIPQYYSMVASAERLMELENFEDEARQMEISDPQSFYNKMKAIVLEDVSFSYDDQRILTDFSVQIKKNSLTVVAGISGKGKSTMMKLLLGLVFCEKGSVYFDTEEGRIFLDAGTRNMFAYVPQGNLILSGSIRENIAFSNQAASEQEIIQAAQIACIWDDIRKLPKGLDTMVRERGAGLSEGQVQRIAIARAILSKAPVLLLDECTSALDEETEKQVLENLKKMHTKTILCISHKEAAIRCCENLIKMDEM